MARPETVVRGRKAFARRDWGEAYAHFAAADRVSRLEPEDIERFASAVYLIGKESDAKSIWMRLHNELIDRDCIESAARVGFWLSLTLLLSGEAAQATGWLARARRLLKDRAGECVARGYGLIVTGLLAMSRGNLEEAHTEFMEAVALADRFGDADLLTLALIGEGQSLVQSGEFTEGAARLDEAMVAVTADDVSPVLAGIAYCAVILTCEQIFDLNRAQEWTRTFDAWCASQPDLVPYRGQCLVHRSELLQAKGDWDGARAEVTKARNHLAGRSEAVVGRACYQQGELHRLRGEFAEAEAMYREARRNGCDPQPGVSLLRLAQGNPETAASAIRSAIETVGRSQGPGAGLSHPRLLAASVDILLVSGEADTARAVAAELAEVAANVGAPVLLALSAQAFGAVLFADGKTRAALARLNESLTAWQALEMPYEAARVRVLLANVYRDLEDDETADMQCEGARAVFEQLGATPDLENLEGSGPVRGSAPLDGLTQREREVLSLVGAGKTNRQIAEELVISEHTVARHVSNIFDKLGVTSRTAASAVAHKRKLV